MNSHKKTTTKQVLPALGDFFRSERFKAGLSTVTVATYLGVTPETLEAYESGSTAIPLNQIYALANCLNISPDIIVKKLAL